MLARITLVGLLAVSLSAQQTEQYFDIFKQEGEKSKAQVAGSSGDSAETKKSGAITYDLQVNGPNVKIVFRNPTNETLYGNFSIKCIENGTPVFSTTVSPVLHSGGSYESSFMMPSSTCQVVVSKEDTKGDARRRAKERKTSAVDGQGVTGAEPSIPEPSSADWDLGSRPEPFDNPPGE